MPLDISATDVELQKPVNVIFQQMLLRNARARCPYFIGTEQGQIQEHGGTATVKWRRIENLTPTTTPLSELTATASYGQGRDSETATFTDITATVQKYGQYYILNEEADLFNYNGQGAKLVETLSISAGRSLNRLQRDIGEDNATLIYAGGASSDGAVVDTIELANIRKAVNDLERNSAMTYTPMQMGENVVGTSPIQPAFWGLCHPDVAIDIAQLSGFVAVERYAGQTDTVLGEFGTLTVAGCGVRFIASEEASIDAGAGGAGSGVRETSSAADLYTVLVYGMEAIGSLGLGQQHTDGIYRAGQDLATVRLITKGLGSGGAADPFDEIMTMAWKAWHAGAVLNGTWLRGIRCAASSLS